MAFWKVQSVCPLTTGQALGFCAAATLRMIWGGGRGWEGSWWLAVGVLGGLQLGLGGAGMRRGVEI